MRRRLVLLDWSLTGRVGHSYEYDRNVIEAFQTKDWLIAVYGHCACSISDVAGVSIKKWFSHEPSDPIVGYRVLRPVAKIWAHVTRSARELERAIAQTDAVETVYFIQHAESYHLPALLLGFRKARGTLVLMLRGTSMTIRGGRSRETFRTRLYRLFFPSLIRALRYRLLLISDSENLRREYESIISQKIIIVPLPNPVMVPAFPRRHSLPNIVMVAGRISPEKGVQYVPALIRQSRALRLPVRFVIHAYTSTGASAQDLEILAELESLEGSDVRLVRTPLSTSEYWDQTRLADVSLLLYDVGRYRNQTSNLVLDALACGTFPIVSAGTWLSEMVETAAYGSVVKMNNRKQIVSDVIDILSKPLPDAVPDKIEALLGFHSANSFYNVITTALGHLVSREE